VREREKSEGEKQVQQIESMLQHATTEKIAMTALSKVLRELAMRADSVHADLHTHGALLLQQKVQYVLQQQQHDAERRAIDIDCALLILVATQDQLLVVQTALEEKSRQISAARRALDLGTDETKRGKESLRQQRAWRREKENERARERENTRDDCIIREGKRAETREMWKEQETGQGLAWAGERQRERGREEEREREKEMRREFVWEKEREREREEATVFFEQSRHDLKKVVAQFRLETSRFEHLQHGQIELQTEIEQVACTVGAQRAQRQELARNLSEERDTQIAKIYVAETQVKCSEDTLLVCKRREQEVEEEMHALNETQKAVLSQHAHEEAVLQQHMYGVAAAHDEAAVRHTARERKQHLSHTRALHMEHIELQRKLQQLRLHHKCAAASMEAMTQRSARDVEGRVTELASQIANGQQRVCMAHDAVRDSESMRDSLQQELQHTHAAATATAATHEQQVVLLQQDIANTNSRILAANASLVEACKALATQEEMVLALHAQLAGVEEEFEQAITTLEAEKTSASEAFQGLTDKCAKETGVLMDFTSAECRDLQQQVNTTQEAVRKLERNLAHAEEEAEVWRSRDETTFHKVTKIGALLESVTGRDAREVRERMLAQMEQNYSSLQRTTTASITRANSLLAHLDHLRDTSRASAISDSALQEQLAQASARLETATAATAHATAEAAAATQRLILLQASVDSLRERVVHEKAHADRAVAWREETHRLQVEVARIRAEAVHIQVISDFQCFPPVKSVLEEAVDAVAARAETATRCITLQHAATPCVGGGG